MGDLTPTGSHLHRFEMRRDADGNFVGTLIDNYGWIVTIKAGMATDDRGKKALKGYGWITAGPPEAGLE